MLYFGSVVHWEQGRIKFVYTVADTMTDGVRFTAEQFCNIVLHENLENKIT